MVVPNGLIVALVAVLGNALVLWLLDRYVERVTGRWLWGPAIVDGLLGFVVFVAVSSWGALALGLVALFVLDWAIIAALTHRGSGVAFLRTLSWWAAMALLTVLIVSILALFGVRIELAAQAI